MPIGITDYGVTIRTPDNARGSDVIQGQTRMRMPARPPIPKQFDMGARLSRKHRRNVNSHVVVPVERDQRCALVQRRIAFGEAVIAIETSAHRKI